MSSCGACGFTKAYHEDHAGRRYRCPNCGGLITVGEAAPPMSSRSDPVESVEEPPRRVASRPTATRVTARVVPPAPPPAPAPAAAPPAPSPSPSRPTVTTRLVTAAQPAVPTRPMVTPPRSVSNVRPLVTPRASGHTGQTRTVDFSTLEARARRSSALIKGLAAVGMLGVIGASAYLTWHRSNVSPTAAMTMNDPVAADSAAFDSSARHLVDVSSTGTVVPTAEPRQAVTPPAVTPPAVAPAAVAPAPTTPAPTTPAPSTPAAATSPAPAAPIDSAATAANDRVQKLVDQLADPNTTIGAVIQLKSIGADAVPQLIGGLHARSSQTRRGAAFALGELGATSSKALGDLTGRLRDTNKWVRLLAAEAIIKIDPAASGSALPVLEASLADPELQSRASEALARIR